MHNSVALVQNHIDNDSLYKIYHNTYYNGIIKKPIIYMNNTNIHLDKMIPVLHTKFLHNQYYEYILCDLKSYKQHKDMLKNRCKEVLIFGKHFDDDKSLYKIIGKKYDTI